MSSPPVSGYSLRIIADLAWAAGQKELATRLHELAREQEQLEARSRGRQCVA